MKCRGRELIGWAICGSLAGCSGHSTVDEGDISYARPGAATPSQDAGTGIGIDCDAPQNATQQLLCDAQDSAAAGADAGPTGMDGCDGDLDVISQLVCSLGLDPDQAEDLLDALPDQDAGAGADMCAGDDVLSQLLCGFGRDGGFDFDGFGRDGGFDFGGGSRDDDADAAVDAGEVDAGPDAGEVDAGETDAGETDAGETDAGEMDAGEMDAGDADAGEEVDAGEADADDQDADPADAE